MFDVAAALDSDAYVKATINDGGNDREVVVQGVNSDGTLAVWWETPEGEARDAYVAPEHVLSTWVEA